MEYKRTPVEHYPFDFPKALETHVVTIIWGNDGWRYIPFLNIRDKFTSKKYYMEKWEGVVAPPCSIEMDVTWTLYSQKPRMWREVSNSKDEIYEVKNPSQTD